MAELNGIAETLRRQRKDLDGQLEITSVRSAETAALLEKIEELRLRSERARRPALGEGQTGLVGGDR